MKVKFTSPTFYMGTSYEAGKEYEIDDASAKAMGFKPKKEEAPKGEEPKKVKKGK